MDYSFHNNTSNHGMDDDELPPTQPLIDDLPPSQTAHELHVTLYDTNGIPWIILDQTTVGRHSSNQIVLPNVPGISAKHGIFYIQIPASSLSSVRRRNQVLNRICIYEDTSSVGTRIIRHDNSGSRSSANTSGKPKKDKVIMVHHGRIRLRNGDVLFFGEEKYRIMDPYEIERQIKLVQKKERLRAKHHPPSTEENDEDNDIDDTLDSYRGNEDKNDEDDDDEEEEEEDQLPCTQAVNHDMVIDYTVEHNHDEFPLQSTNSTATTTTTNNNQLHGKANTDDDHMDNALPMETNISIDEQQRHRTHPSRTTLSSASVTDESFLSPVNPTSNTHPPKPHQIATLNNSLSDEDDPSTDEEKNTNDNETPSSAVTADNTEPSEEHVAYISRTQLDTDANTLHLLRNHSSSSSKLLSTNTKPFHSTSSLASSTNLLQRQNTIYDDDEENDTDVVEDTPSPKTALATKHASSQGLSQDNNHNHSTATKETTLQSTTKSAASKENFMSPNFDVPSLQHTSTNGITPGKGDTVLSSSSSQKILHTNLPFTASSPEGTVPSLHIATTNNRNSLPHPPQRDEENVSPDEILPSPSAPPLPTTDSHIPFNHTQTTSASQLPPSSFMHSNREILSASLEYAYDLPSQLMDMNDNSLHPSHTHVMDYHPSTHNRNKTKKKLSNINDILSHYLSPSKLVPLQNSIEPTQRYIPASAEDEDVEGLPEEKGEEEAPVMQDNDAHYEGSPVLGRMMNTEYTDNTLSAKESNGPVRNLESPAKRSEPSAAKTASTHRSHGTETRGEQDETEYTGGQSEVQFSVMVSDSEENNEEEEKDNDKGSDETNHDDAEMDQPPTEDWNHSNHTSQVIGVPEEDGEEEVDHPNEGERVTNKRNSAEEEEDEDKHLRLTNEIQPSSTVIVTNSHILDHNSSHLQHHQPSMQHRSSLSTDDVSITESQSMAALLAVQSALQLHNPPSIKRLSSLNVHNDVRAHAQTLRNSTVTNGNTDAVRRKAIPSTKTSPTVKKSNSEGEDTDEANSQVSEEDEETKIGNGKQKKQVTNSPPVSSARRTTRNVTTKTTPIETKKMEDESSPKRSRTSKTPVIANRTKIATTTTTTTLSSQPQPVRSSSRVRVPRKILGDEDDEDNDRTVTESKGTKKNIANDVVLASSGKGRRGDPSTEDTDTTPNAGTKGKSGVTVKLPSSSSQNRTSPRKRKRDEDLDEIIDEIPVPLPRTTRSTTTTASVIVSNKEKIVAPKEKDSTVPYETRRRSLTVPSQTSTTVISPIPTRKSTAFSATKSTTPTLSTTTTSSTALSTTGRGYVPKLCISRVSEDDEETLPVLAKALGAELIREVDKDTILVTPAIMATLRHATAITLGKGIRTPAWIRESSRAGRWIDGQGYEPTETSGILKDILGPRFDVPKSMVRRTMYANKPGIGIFTNMDIYVFPGTTTDENLQEIRELGKGNWLETLPNISTCKRLIKENKLWLIASNEGHGPILHKYYYDHSRSLEKKKHLNAVEKGTLAMVPYHTANVPIYDRGLLVVSLLLQTKPPNLDNYVFQYFDEENEG